MRLIARIFVFISALFIILYGVLPGFFRVEGDFIANYVAGKNFLAGVDPTLFYRFPDFQRLIDGSGLSKRIFYFSLSTPSSILLDSIISIPPAALSKFLLTALYLAAFVLLVHATSKVAKASVRTSYLIFLSSSFALATNFSSSEPYIILTLLFVLVFYAFTLNAEGAAGVILGLIFPFKVFAGIPAVLFLIAKKWRTFLYFVVTSIVVLLITYLVVGESVMIYYLQRVFPFYLNGSILNPFSISYQTAWSFFRRVFLFDATLNTYPLIASRAAYVLAISIFKASIAVPATYFFYKGIERKDSRESLIAATFPIIFLSPTGSTFQLVLLAPATICLVQTAFESRYVKMARLFLVLYAVLCIPIFNALATYLKVTTPFLLYERFFLLLILYVSYLVFQLRLVPKSLRTARVAISIGVIAAVSVTLYIGDRTHTGTAPRLIRPAITGSALKSAAFSPGLDEETLTYITYDSGSVNFVLYGVSLVGNKPYNCYQFASDKYGKSRALEITTGAEDICYFKTESADASYDGGSVSVSPDGDWGSFLQKGKLYIVQLQPRHISLADSLNFLPFKITQASFNRGIDSEITLVIDSLNTSRTVEIYNVADRKLSVFSAPFSSSLICADKDNFYMTRENGDSTDVWLVRNDTSPRKLLAVHGNISDITVIGNDLYFSSDFDRGLNLPTIYRYEIEKPIGVRE